MIQLGAGHVNYLPSSLLSKKIRLFNERCVTLLPYLRELTCLQEINTEQTFEASLVQMCKCVEPIVLHCRSAHSEASKETRHDIE